ncbi:hypothetical protein MAR_032085 [Mya arenaria]|uniref:Uncharacterized protein n=1 Tax=Mya arenaria TaxID=6604 RepID=A0ABY7F912_MYAAR|nr:hypothetical protein MAR_032085 [Mya arenaria]
MNDLKTEKTLSMTFQEFLTSLDLSKEDYIQANSDVDVHNDVVCDSQGQKQIISKSKDVVLGDMTEVVKERIIQKIPSDISKTMGLASNVRTAIGLNNELSCNVDVEDGLTNGADEGHFDKSKSFKYLWARFEDEHIGRKCRETNRSLYNIKVNKHWTPIFRIKRQFPIDRYQSALVMRSQFPIRCAAAKTCHRCQGDTLQTAVVDFAGKGFAHAHYVALSRVTNLENLHVRNLNEPKIRVDKRVLSEMDRLKETSVLPIIDYCLSQLQSCVFSLLYQNVWSLRKHFQDILISPVHNLSHINIFSETKLSEKDNSGDFIHPGFQFHRYDSKHSCTYGMAAFTKPEVDF